jgi:hypothetical protein
MAVQSAHLESGHLSSVEVLELPRPGRVLVGPWPRPAAEPVGEQLGRARQEFTQAVAGLIAAWAYPTSASRRDLRIDLLRGLCVFAMLADHLGGESWLYVITGGNRSSVSAAEGFIFISGLVVGQVYVGKIQRLGLVQAVLQALKRASTLYAATVVMTLIFTGLRLYTQLALWVPRDVPTGDQSLVETILGTFSLHRTYHGTDILAMYVFCLAAAAGALALLSFGRWRWVLGISALVWLSYQLNPADIQLPWYIRNSENFPLAAWQVLFMTGLVIGYHRHQLAAWLQARPRGRLVLVALAVGVSIAIAWYFQLAGEAALDVFAKAPLRPARLVAFAAAAVVAYTLATLTWEPLRHALGWLLLPLGQHALYCYVMHFFLIVLIMNIVPGELVLQHGWASPVLLGTVLQLGLVLIVWTFIRRRVLFGLVPN